MMFALPAILDQQGIQDLVNPRYCPQDNTGFYTFDVNINPLQDLVSYCPQDTRVYENVVSGSPTVPSIMTTDTALWLDANDASTITLESGAVSEWRDKSGNNRHATQTTASNRPLLVSGGLNGTDVIRFDGSNDFLSLATPLLTDNYSIFAILKIIDTSKRAFLSQNSNTGNATRLIVYGLSTITNPTQFMGFQNGAFASVSGTPDNNRANLYGYFRSGTSIKQHHNGGVENVGVVTAGNSEQVNLKIGEGTVTSYFHGDIAQIIIFPRVLTQTERELVEGYLAWSVGLEGNLPSNHPYKNSYPGISVTPTLVGTIYDFDQAP